MSTILSSTGGNAVVVAGARESIDCSGADSRWSGRRSARRAGRRARERHSDMTASVSSMQITTIAHCDLFGSEQSRDGDAKDQQGLNERGLGGWLLRTAASPP